MLINYIVIDMMMNDKGQEMVYLNNCELILQSISLNNKGTYYLVWKKGKKTTQSHQFQIINERPLSNKETLALTLKVYHHHNLPLPRHTHLILYNSNRQEICREKIMIHEWADQYRFETVQLSEGTVKMRVRRKPIMRLQKFHQMRSEVQQSSEDERSKYLKKGSLKVNAQKEEMVRLRKQVEDVKYLADKLKEERNDGLIRIESLQSQVAQINEKMTKDVSKLKEYLALKLEMRESVYKEEIQNVISSFNKNYDFNYSIINSLIKEKYEYESEIQQLRESHLDYINKQEEHYDGMAEAMKISERKINDQLILCLQKIKEKEFQVVSLNDMLDQLQGKYNQLDHQHKLLENKHENLDRESHKTIESLMLTIEQTNARRAEDQQLIKKMSNESEQKGKQINQFNQVIAESYQEKAELSRQKYELQIIRDSLNQKIDMLEMTIEENIRSLKSSTEQIERMAEEYQLRSEQYQKQINDANIASHLEITKATEDYHKLTIKYEENVYINNELKQTVQLYEQREKEKDLEFQNFKNELQGERLRSQKLQQEISENIQSFRVNQDELNKRLAESLQLNTFFQFQNNRLKSQNVQLNDHFTKQIEKMKSHYEGMFESEKKILEDDIEMLKNQREEQNEQYEHYKLQYEIQIKNMTLHQQSETEELEFMYRQEMELKTAEYLELMLRYDNLTKQFQQYKHLIDLEKIQTEEEAIKTKRLKKSLKNYEVEEIIKEESEQVVEISSQQDSEQEERAVPKGRSSGRRRMRRAHIAESNSSSGSQQQSVVKKMQKRQSERSRNSLSIASSNQKSKEKIDSEKSIENHIKESPVKRKLTKNQNIVQLYIQSSEQMVVDNRSKRRNKVQTSKMPKSGRAQQRTTFDTQLIEQLQAKIGEQADRIFRVQAQLALSQKKQLNATSRIQRQAKKHITKIREIQYETAQLNKEIDILTGKLQEVNEELAKKAKENVNTKRKAIERKKTLQINMIQEMNKVEEEIKLEEIQQEKAMKVVISQRQSERSIKHENKVLRKISEDLAISKRSNQDIRHKERVQELQELLGKRERTIEQMEKNIKLKSKQLEQFRFQRGEGRNPLYESKQIDYGNNQQKGHYLQPSQRNKPQHMQLSFGQFNIKASIAQLQDKVSNERERHHDIKLRYEQKIKQNEHLETELRKLKSLNTQLEEKARRNHTIPKSLQDLQKQLEECNQKILEVSRNLNQVRLERDSHEDQVRILRKKLSENQKNSQEWQSKALQSEREMQDFKRKDFKLKRQLEQRQQEQKRLKDLMKRSAQQSNQMRKMQSQFLLQRKKVLNEVVRLEDVVAQKQTELLKVNKQAQKLRQKFSEEGEGKNNRQKSLSIQIEKNQVERRQLQRKSRQLQQVNRMLLEKWQSSERENKKMLEQRKQTYGQKLKRYIQQIINVKKIVEQLQEENVRFKIQNSEFFEQNEILKMSYERLQLKHEQLSEQQRTLESQLIKRNNEMRELQETIKRKASEEQKRSVLVAGLRKQLQNQRVGSRKKSEKLQSYEQINERYQYEIKNLKIRLNEVKNNVNDRNQLTQQLNSSQKTIDSLQEQLHKVTSQYQDHSTTYLYTKQDLHNAIQDLKEYERKLKEEELTTLIQQLDANHSYTREKMENELIQLYTENQKLRVNLQKQTQESLELQMQSSELQTFRDRSKRLQKQRNSLQRKVSETQDQLKSSREELRRIEVKFNDSIRSQQGKSAENMLLSRKYEQVNVRLVQMRDSCLQLKGEQKKALSKYKSVSDERQRMIETLNAQVQHLSNRCLELQLEANRFKQLERISTQENQNKIKQLQAQLDEVTQHHTKTQKEANHRTKNTLRDLNQRIARHEEQIAERNYKIQELNEALLMLQSEIQEITQELTGNRAQLADDNQFYTIQLNQLRTEMNQMQDTHQQHIQSLEEELCMMSQELVSYKVNRQTSNSRLRQSRQSDNGDQKQRRFQEKIKLKDRRIEQLKQTVIALEEKIKGLTTNESKGEVVELRRKMEVLQNQRGELLYKKEMECSKWLQQCKRMKDQLLSATGQQQRLRLKIEQALLEVESLTAENKTVSMLYTELQYEIEKRQQTTAQQSHIQQLETTNAQYQQSIQLKIQHIAQLQQQIDDHQQRLKQLQQQYNNMHSQQQQIVNQNQQLRHQRQHQHQKDTQNNQNTQHTLQYEHQTTKVENRRLKNDLNQALKLNDHFKSQISLKTSTIEQLVKEMGVNESKLIQNQHLINRWIGLNEKSRNLLGLQIQDSLHLCIEQRQLLNQNAGLLQKTNDDRQELTFLYQRKTFDYQELKKQNYKMTIKVEQLQLNADEIEHLMWRVEQLQREKEKLLVREEAIKEELDLFNEHKRTNSNIKKNIYTILTDKLMM